MKSILTALLLVAPVSGCATAPASPASVTNATEDSLPLVRTGAAVATGTVLDFTVAPGRARTPRASEMCTVVRAIDALAGTGTIPTPAQFTAVVSASVSGDRGKFSAALGSIYASRYPGMNDARTASDVLYAIAGGIEDAVQSYVAAA